MRQHLLTKLCPGKELKTELCKACSEYTINGELIANRKGVQDIVMCEFFQNSNAGMILNKQGYERLLHFLGYGDFSRSRLMIFGIEEGIGELPYEASYLARCRSFGRDTEGNYMHCLKEKHWESGFYERSAPEADEKALRYVEKPVARQGAGNVYVDMISRVAAALEHDEIDPDYWFNTDDKNPEAASEIRRMKNSGILVPREGVQTTLVAWRPLPRKSMGDWPIGLFDNMNQRKYLNAFAFRTDEEQSDSFTNYTRDVERRKSLIRNLLEFGDVKNRVVISFGVMQEKKRVLENIFEGMEFSEIEIREGDISLGYKGTLSMNGRDIFFFLLPFPGGTSSTFTTMGIHYLDYFKVVFERYILRAYHDNFIPEFQYIR